jgi:mRNA interferase YafQ
MKNVRRTSQFKKDVKRMEKRGKDFSGFKEVVGLLINGQTIGEKYRDYPLTGQYVGTRECHIELDWLLIYESAEDEIVLIRTGSHSDLFKPR